MYPYLEVFGRAIPMYYLSAIVGLVFAMGLALFRRRAERFHTGTEDIVLMVLLAVIGALLGSKVFQLVGVIIRDGQTVGFWTLEHWKSLIPGVGVFYGGLIGGFIAVLIYIRKNKLDFWEIADILVPCVLLFCTFGRLGCFFAGCCYGRAADWGIMPRHGVEPLIPVQLFEAGFTFLTMAAMLIFRPERKRPGVLLPLYILIYAVGRFILEFFRGDMQRGVYLLSTSQWISLLMIPAGIFLLVLRNRALSKGQRDSSL
ncbi:MAG: prolipoprotein diacylglyceryl transferase [Oscillospiraceae bacterium]|jgi:phosphatidylglycerol:prolipoprotein diacylglycerol transferase|nr:prolipoprotein diacylglyceryl transferase [Oscillospiraceae bacterium]